MRLADVIFRRGHLSERELADVCLTGARPAHLDRCDICAERADVLGRWLDDVRTMGIEEADQMFPAERLAAQQGQILRRLEQADRPSRVITFPGQPRSDRFDGAVQGIRPAWIGVAAAAGIVLGLVGSQVSGHFLARAAAPSRPPAQTQQPANSGTPAGPVLAYETMPTLDLDVDEGRPHIDAVEALDTLTPHLIPVGDEGVRTTKTKR